MKKLSPEIVEFEITLSCPLRCLHCYCRAGESNEQPSTAEARSVLDQLKKAGTRYVDLVGGEPLTREDILEVLAYAREINQSVMVNTNGVLLTRDLAKELKKANPHILFGVSIDGATPQTCDLVRGRGTFEKAVSALQILKAEGFKVVSLFVVNALNWGEFEEYVHLMTTLGVDGIYVDRFIPVGRGADNAKILDMESRGWLKALKHVNAIISKYANAMRFFVEESVSGEPCSAGKTHASILVDLRVVPCGHFRYDQRFTMGSLREKSFEEIWGTCPGLISTRSRGDECVGCPAYSLAKTGEICMDEVIYGLLKEKQLEKEAMV